MVKKKIVFVGMPDMALICLNKLVAEGFQIVGVIPPHSSNPSSQTIKMFAQALDLEVFEFENSPNEADFVEKIKNLNADIGIVCSYDILLSKDFLNTTKDGYINCHPSLLPDYRGANPYHHVIRNGETKSGVTLHFMDETFDTGHIIYQKEFALDDKETMGTLFNNSNYIFAQAICDALGAYEEKGKLYSRPQEKREYKTAPKVSGEIVVDLNQPVEDIERLIRSSNPFYSCNTFFRGTPLRLISIDYLAETHGLPAGQVASHNQKLAITAQNGYLYPKVVQLGSWGFFDAEEFIQKFSPQVGEKVGV